MAPSLVARLWVFPFRVMALTQVNLYIKQKGLPFGKPFCFDRPRNPLESVLISDPWLMGHLVGYALGCYF